MTQKKVSHERVVELLDLDLFYYERRRGDLIKVPCDRKDAVWARSGTTEHRLDSIDFTDPAWTGPLLGAYQRATAEPYLDNVLLSLSRWAYKLSPDGEMTLNEIIIAALDAIKGEE